MKDNTMQLFEDRGIQSILDERENEWYFSIVDTIEYLTDSPNPRVYWRVLKGRLRYEIDSVDMVELKKAAMPGKKKLADVANADQLLNIMKLLPDKKAEPLKQWLEQSGSENKKAG